MSYISVTFLLQMGNKKEMVKVCIYYHQLLDTSQGSKIVFCITSCKDNQHIASEQNKLCPSFMQSVAHNNR